MLDIVMVKEKSFYLSKLVLTAFGAEYRVLTDNPSTRPISVVVTTISIVWFQHSSS